MKLPIPMIPPPRRRSARVRLLKAVALALAGVLATVGAIALDAPAGVMLAASLLTFAACGAGFVQLFKSVAI